MILLAIPKKALKNSPLRQIHRIWLQDFMDKLHEWIWKDFKNQLLAILIILPTKPQQVHRNLGILRSSTAHEIFWIEVPNA